MDAMGATTTTATDDDDNDNNNSLRLENTRVETDDFVSKIGRKGNSR